MRCSLASTGMTTGVMGTMGRSATNVIGNSLATAVVAKWEGELKAEHELGPDDAVPSDAVAGDAVPAH